MRWDTTILPTLFAAVVLTACASTDPDYVTCEDGDGNVRFVGVRATFDTLRVAEPFVSFKAEAKIADCGIRVELGDPAESIPVVTWPDYGYLHADLQLSDSSRSGPLRVWYAGRLVLDTNVVITRAFSFDGAAYYRRRLTWEELHPIPPDIENVYLLDLNGSDRVVAVDVDSLGIVLPYHRGIAGGLLRAYSPSRNVVYTTGFLPLDVPPVSAVRSGDEVSIRLGDCDWQADEGLVLFLENNYPQGKSYQFGVLGNTTSGPVEPGSYSVWCHSQAADIYFKLGNLLIP